MSESYEIVSVKDGKFHLPKDTQFTHGDAWKRRLMLCGRMLEPLNYFVAVQDADRYTGGRFAQKVCQQCEAVKEAGR